MYHLSEARDAYNIDLTLFMIFSNISVIFKFLRTGILLGTPPFLSFEVLRMKVQNNLEF